MSKRRFYVVISSDNERAAEFDSLDHAQAWCNRINNEGTSARVESFDSYAQFRATYPTTDLSADAI